MALQVRVQLLPWEAGTVREHSTGATEDGSYNADAGMSQSARGKEPGCWCQAWRERNARLCPKPVQSQMPLIPTVVRPNLTAVQNWHGLWSAQRDPV